MRGLSPPPRFQSVCESWGGGSLKPTAPPISPPIDYKSVRSGVDNNLVRSKYNAKSTVSPEVGGARRIEGGANSIWCAPRLWSELLGMAVVCVAVISKQVMYCILITSLKTNAPSLDCVRTAWFTQVAAQSSHGFSSMVRSNVVVLRI